MHIAFKDLTNINKLFLLPTLKDCYYNSDGQKIIFDQCYSSPQLHTYNMEYFGSHQNKT